MVWRALYATLLVLAYPFVVLLLIWRGARNPEYRGGRRERLGWAYAEVPRDVVWVHAVSAGEVIAAAPLIRRLITLLPETRVLVTTMTPTGANQVRRLLGSRVSHCYAPYDFPWALRRFMKRVRPQLLVLMETELWPNMVRMSVARGIPVVLINARLSERSARGYRRIAGLTRSMLSQLTWIAAQYTEHAQRFLDLGAPPASSTWSATSTSTWRCRTISRARCGIEGSLANQRSSGLDRRKHARREDEIVLDAHRRLLETSPDALLILVPRHPQRLIQWRNSPSDGLMMRRMASALRFDRAGHPRRHDGPVHLPVRRREVAFIGGSLAALGRAQPDRSGRDGSTAVHGSARIQIRPVTAAFERPVACIGWPMPRPWRKQLAGLFDDSDAAPEVEAARAKQVVATYAGAPPYRGSARRAAGVNQDATAAWDSLAPASRPC